MSAETIPREQEALRHIAGIKFGILSPSEIRKLSVTSIQTADTYDEDGLPIQTGLMDGRLGTLEPGQRCRTCGNTAVSCPGHFGHIELAQPVIHISFVDTIYDYLTTTCRNCGRVLLSQAEIDNYKQKIEELKKGGGDLDKFYDQIKKEAKKAMECPHCGQRQCKIEFRKPTSFYEVLEEGGERRLTPSMIRDRLERIPDEDVEILGGDPKNARPEWMILQVLPVPPVYVRPSITLESGIRSEDDLTHKLVDIVRINQRLKENMDNGAPAMIIQDLAELLQYHVTTYFDNEASGIPPARHRSGRALKTLSQRLKGKEGRFRGNLSGKRVDFSARTVISPDPNLDINEVGVPIDVAKRLTVPERVTTWNLEEMRKLVINGPDKYPGALYVIRPDKKRIRLEFVADRTKIAEALEPGYIVERHIRDGDIALFNRQPSLHRMSIMTHYVRVLPYKTFRLNLAVCVPYNADFDGDEMNLHIPQSEEARSEAHLLMRVQDQILSPRYGGPIIGAIRDHITGIYLLTHPSTLLKKSEVLSLLGAVNYKGPLPEPVVKEPEPMWSGKQLFSLALPRNFNFVQKAGICRSCPECLKENCPYDAYVIVKDGVLLRGTVDKSVVGAEKSESLYHRIVKDYGTEAGRHFISFITKLAIAYLDLRGFTYSFDELLLDESVKERVTRIMQESDKKVEDLIRDYKEGRLQKFAGQTLEETLEIKIMDALAKARDDAGGLVEEYFDPLNNGIVMTSSGARGSKLNIGQMTACLGQQSIRGKRILRGYKNRALPHFKPDDISPAARGFVRSNYRDGLSPTEFFFHAIGGREGLVDTAVRTQQSGYLQRRLINALEFLRVEYDGTVRDPLGNIIQLKYGEDGVDPAKSDHGKAVNIKRLIDRIKLTITKGKKASKEYIEKKVEEVADELVPKLVSELKELLLTSGLTEEAVDTVVSQTVKEYVKAQVEPGEAVGIVAAQSIGEPGTQMTLRTFHYAGVREQNVTLGLPRLIEILDAKKLTATAVMTVYLDKEHRKSKEKAMKIAQELLYTSVGDVAHLHIDIASGVIVLTLNKAEASYRNVKLSDIENALRKVPHIKLETREDRIIVYPPDLSAIRSFYEKILSVHVKGIKGIRRVIVDKREGEWVIYTEGSNLAEVLKFPGVDHRRTITNDLYEIQETLGIEAARNAIIREAMKVLEEQGLDVDIRHIMLVADVMTHTGDILQIGRHGVSGEKASVLAKAAFEITVPNLVNAAVRGTQDPLKGVTENVIVGQQIPVGTGLVEIYMEAPVTEHERRD